MRKVEYPTDSDKRSAFKKAFKDGLNADITAIDDYLKAISFNGEPLTFDKLATMSFDDLIQVKDDLIKLKEDKSVKNKDGKEIENKFTEHFDYDKNRGAIAAVFIKYLPTPAACYYCGVNPIDSFSDVKWYKDPLHFINHAEKDELYLIDRISKNEVELILKEQPKISDISSLPISSNTKTAIENKKLRYSHRSFTLDHVLPQGEYEFFALCLFNLVPSCAACNMRYKHKKEFKVNSELPRICPTSDSYKLDQDFEFRIIYDKLDDIADEKEYFLMRHIQPKNPINLKAAKNQIEEYLRIFKIDGRYEVYKPMIINMIENRIEYPESQIQQYASLTKNTEKQIRKWIFGEELFEEDRTREPLVKFKRDIAKSKVLEIEGVL